MQNWAFSAFSRGEISVSFFRLEASFLQAKQLLPFPIVAINVFILLCKKKPISKPAGWKHFASLIFILPHLKATVLIIVCVCILLISTALTFHYFLDANAHSTMVNTMLLFYQHLFVPPQPPYRSLVLFLGSHTFISE